MRMQPMVIGHHYMASAGQYLATEAAHAILRAGGNAIDAGVAGGIALGVVHSDQVQFSGVAPMLIYLADRDETVSIAGLGGWPKALDARQLHARPQRHDSRGPPAHGGSGGARCLDPGASALRHHELRRRRGVGDPLRARRLRGAHRHGDVPAGQGRGLPALAAEHRDLSSRRRPLREGDRLVQADLGRTIQFMADQEKAAAGKGRDAGLAAARDAFYRGDIAADDRRSITTRTAGC